MITSTGVAISLGWYRIQKPLKPGNTKKIQNHPFPVWPQKYGKNTEKLQKWSFSGQFCNFSVIFFVFLGPNQKWVILQFFRISRLEGFLYSVAPQGDRNTSTGAKFWLRFGLSVLVLVIFLSPSSLAAPYGVQHIPHRCKDFFLACRYLYQPS